MFFHQDVDFTQGRDGLCSMGSRHRQSKVLASHKMFCRWKAVWQEAWKMKVLLLQVVIALSSKTCTLAAPRYVFWCLGSTVGAHEYLGLHAMPAVMLPWQHQKRQQIGIGELHAQEISGF